MEIYLYNTLTHEKEKFKPIHPNEVKMYSCGPTVYSYAHIGNMRAYIFADTLKRMLEYNGLNVNHVMNITDVGHLTSDADTGEDKMEKAARSEGRDPYEIAAYYTKYFMDDIKSLNIEIPTTITKATDNIIQMEEMVKEIVDNGYGYETSKGIYFDITKLEKYPVLSNNKLSGQEAGARIEVDPEKRNPADFALWIKAPKEHLMKWESPWGLSYPGWHIECSAMSRRYLGDSFDIHGGGLDLIFPHHENEMAQSKCGCGGTFARYWMHNGYININGEKMSKSSGSFVLLRDILKHFEGRVIRLFVLGSHYRKPMEFSDTELNQTKSSLERIENTLKRIKELDRENIKGIDDCQELLATKKEMEAKFIEAMDEDFNTAQALGYIFELVKAVNKTLDEVNISKKGLEVIDEVYSYLVMIIQNVLGVKLKLEVEVNNISADLIELILELRRDAREEKNWALSDKIRDRLLELGIKIKDGKDKTTWTM